MALTGEQALGAARKYVKDTCNGLGAVRGANCTVSEVQEGTTSAKITFKWTGNDGTSQTSSVTIKHGLSIVAVDVDADGRLHCTLSDGSVVDSTGTINLSDYIKEDDADNKYQPKGNYVTTEMFDELKGLITSGGNGVSVEEYDGEVVIE